MTKQLTLCIVRQNGKVLLGMKKRGFGVGRWNGFGGKVHEGETIEDAARRELREECSIVPNNLIERGILTLIGEDEHDLEVHIFEITKFKNQPQETEEMRPQWFDESVLPFHQMWPDDAYWFPLFLQGKKFTGTFVFKDDKIIEYSLNTV